MKKLNVLTRMLLLVALLVGSTSSVWAKQYRKITSTSDLVDGAKYLIISVESSGKYYAIGDISSNYRAQVEVSVSGDIVTETVATSSGSENVYEVQLVAYSENTWNLFDVANGKYINGGAKKKSGNNNYLKTDASLETGTGTTTYNGVWSISVNQSTGVATIKNQNNFILKYNSGQSWFGSYSSGQTDVCLYKEIAEPAAPIINSTWDFSSAVSQAAALNGSSFTASAENTLYDTNRFSTIIYSAGSGDEMNTNGYLKSNGTTSNSNKRYFILEIANNGTLEIFSNSYFGTYSIKKAATASTSWSDATEITTVSPTSETPSASTDITYDADKPYLFIGLTAKAYTQKIIWTPTNDKITLTTTNNMDGWRAFYDATQGYTVDANTKVYKVSKSDVDDEVTMETITGGVPANTPLILKTSAADHKMVLTKANPSVEVGTNLLRVTKENDNLSSGVYRLGYSDADGVGFYPYSVASAAAGIVYLDPSDIQTSGSARGLTMVFEDETDGIISVERIKMNNDSTIYNLSGQRVGNDYKGIVIVNGKKYVRK